MPNIMMLIQYVSIVLIFIEIVYVFLQKPSEIKSILLLMVICAEIMMVGYAMEINATTQEAAIQGTKTAYIGKPFTSLFALLFSLYYCGYKPKKAVLIGAIVFNAGFTLAVMTNEQHYLFYSSVGYDASLPYSKLILGHGPIYYLYTAVTFINSIINTVIAVREYRRSETKEGRVQVLYIFGLITFGVIGFIMFLSGITGGFDTTMTGCFIGTVLLLILFYKYRLFDTLTLVKDQALNDSKTGLLVADKRGAIVYKNTMVSGLIQNGLTSQEILEFPDGKTQINLQDKIYSVNKRTVVDKGRFFGKTIEISDITDTYLYSARLERDVADRTREITHIQRSVIAGLANIVEARDDSTGLHIKRTAAYSRLIAGGLRENGVYGDILTPEYIERLADVAPLHDIGKISIPDYILLKPGPLTPEEFEIIKTHTTRGKMTIEQTMRGVETNEYVSMAEDVALYHHEKWDGTGYPYGIGGNKIPLSARIMAIADVYDAICSKRCYKDAVSPEEARQVIIMGSGTHFDPFVVEAFLRKIDGIESIAREK